MSRERVVRRGREEDRCRERERWRRGREEDRCRERERWRRGRELECSGLSNYARELIGQRMPADWSKPRDCVPRLIAINVSSVDGIRLFVLSAALVAGSIP